ncbi:TonB-dependent receptor [Sphingomonas baiyangensis]|uniref:TonB-dependent receptor n=1 Tax=Sphingomonas baiyangensis TaxID=2572576 RepID=A0A4U1KZT0_9SPHN|nr:TonB-dependent receptor [Sphingomonas baiyangensis]TKD49882.1 TonB-dependent receptor [Sphingomonas baiyangensis]
MPGLARRACASSLAIALALGAPGIALAQEAAPEPPPSAEPAQDAADSDGDAGGEIVVTGSRIARAGFSAPTPVTVLGADRLENTAVSSVGEAIQQLPSVLATASATTAGVTVGAGGFRTINLRGLGAPRTLVLVNGRRFVGSTSEGTVDTNLIPTALVDRVEVVTGGASAAYGSDAVAGVVNLILNDRLEGLKLTLQSGISEDGDDRDLLFSGAVGTSFAGGRGHVVLGGEYADNSGVGNCYREAMPNRRFCQEEWQVLSNTTPGVNGYPAFVVTDNVHTGLLAQGGVINSGPLRGNQFDANGELIPFEYGILPGLFMGGGSGEFENPFRTAGVIKVPVERIAAFGRAGYEITDTIDAFVEASYGRVNVITQASQIRDTALVIQRSNPFLTPSTVARMTQLGLQTITVGRAGDDLGFALGDTTVETWRAAAGLNGTFGADLKWDAYYQYGRTDFTQEVSNNRINANFTRAIQATRDPATGQVVCAATLSPDPAVRAAAAGCVPLNIIGRNRFTPEAKAYSFGTSRQDTTLEQHVVAANLRGTLADLWAGPFSFAVGAEHRQDSIAGTADPISQRLGFFVTNGTTFDAPAVKVTEGYAEALLPLLRDLPFARHLELNGAVRYTDYSTSGGVTTWKLGGIWEPIDAIRLRATRSRDIRAPNVSELFSPLTSTFSSILDRRTGVNTLTPILRGGNPGLRPEVADTWTVGASIQPRLGFLDGLRFSVDYYDIEIRDAIGVIGAQTIANRCFEGAQEFCAFLVIDPTTGVIQQATDRFLNVNRLTTRGLDFELDYATDIGAAGRLGFRGLATHVFELVTTDSAGSVDRAGQTGVPVSAIPGVPDWTFDGTVTWDYRPLSVSFQGRYITEGKYDNTLVGPQDEGFDIRARNSINDNRVDAYFIANLSLRLNVGDDDRFQFFGVVNNLFNREPPLAPGSQGYTNAVLFDQVMRTFRAGVRIRM